jgi:hypothetical protein
MTEAFILGGVRTPFARRSGVAGQRTGTYQCWPPEPGSEDSEDAWYDERAHDQGVEQPADADGRAQLTDSGRSLVSIASMVKANTRPRTSPHHRCFRERG